MSHADFVPGVAAGPVREPGVESDEEVAEDDSALRTVIAEATGGSGVAPNGAAIVPTVAAGTGAFALIEASREVDLVVIGTARPQRHHRADRRLDQAGGHGPRPLPGRHRSLSRALPPPPAHPLPRVASACRITPLPA